MPPRRAFHQLVRRHEPLRARNPQRQGQLLASLATAGQQNPIIVVAVPDAPDRYLVTSALRLWSNSAELCAISAAARNAS